MFFNSFTANEKYSLLNSHTLFQHLEMQLSQKQKKFSQLFCPFSKFRFNFEHFPKKDDPHS